MKTRLSDSQLDAVLDLSNYIGERVEVCTSEYTRNSAGKPLYPESFKPVTILHHRTIASLHKRGLIHVVDTYWRGATVIPLSTINNVLEAEGIL